MSIQRYDFYRFDVESDNGNYGRRMSLPDAVRGPCRIPRSHFATMITPRLPSDSVPLALGGGRFLVESPNAVDSYVKMTADSVEEGTMQRAGESLAPFMDDAAWKSQTNVPARRGSVLPSSTPTSRERSPTTASRSQTGQSLPLFSNPAATRSFINSKPIGGGAFSFGVQLPRKHLSQRATSDTAREAARQTRCPSPLPVIANSQTGRRVSI